jgi:hypothetical protein
MIGSRRLLNKLLLGKDCKGKIRSCIGWTTAIELPFQDDAHRERGPNREELPVRGTAVERDGDFFLAEFDNQKDGLDATKRNLVAKHFEEKRGGFRRGGWPQRCVANMANR